MASLGYTPLASQPYIYVRPPRTSADPPAGVSMWVDDGAMVYTDDKDAKALLAHLSGRYGPVRHTYAQTGVPVYHAGHTITVMQNHLSISQAPYVKKLLQTILGPEVATLQTKPTPSTANLFSVDPTALPVDIKRYQSDVGGLIYLHMRPDVIKEITYLASFTHCPTQDHVRKMRRLLQYLKGTADMTMLFPRNTPIQLTTYADAAFAVHPGSRSQYGIMHSLGPLFW